jgi:uncharacterized RDD family membrane protein YckC
VTEQRGPDGGRDDLRGSNGTSEYAHPAEIAGSRAGDPGSPAAAVVPAEPASLGRRFGALLVDWILCLLVSNFVADPRQVAWPPVVILILEYGFFLGLFGQTPGMWLARIRCVSVAHGGPVGILRALARGALLALVVPALIMDERRRGLHDRVAGSIVVEGRN